MTLSKVGEEGEVEDPIAVNEEGEVAYEEIPEGQGAGLRFIYRANSEGAVRKVPPRSFKAQVIPSERLCISTTDLDGANVRAFLEQWGRSTTSNNRGYLLWREPGESEPLAVWVIFGEAELVKSEGTEFVRLAATAIEKSGPPSWPEDEAEIELVWVRTGDQGKEGPAGPEGKQGKEGPAGPEGLPGHEGPEGKQGPEGKVGAEGKQGPEGKVGPEGKAGPEGKQGIQGKEGPQGKEGKEGPPGPNELTESVSSIRWFEGANAREYIRGFVEAVKTHILEISSQATSEAKSLVRFLMESVKEGSLSALRLRVQVSEVVRTLLDGEGKSNFLQLSTVRSETDWGLVGALPAKPSVGDRCIYQPAEGIKWDMVYDGVGEFPWKKIGGPPLFAQATAEVTCKSAAYETNGSPSINAPNAGVYRIAVSARYWTGGAGQYGYISPKVGAAAAEDNNGAKDMGGSGVGVIGYHVAELEVKAAGTTIQSQIRVAFAEGNFSSRYMTIDPVRVK